MTSAEGNIIQLLEFLEEVVDKAPKMPMTGKVMLDKKEINEILDEIRIHLPDQIRKAQRIMEEKDRIIDEADKAKEILLENIRIECENIRLSSIEAMKSNVENHDIVKDARAKSEEILALAQKDAKEIRIGSREYSTAILMELDKQIEIKKFELITSMQNSFENVAKEIDQNLSNATEVIKENISELKHM